MAPVGAESTCGKILHLPEYIPSRGQTTNMKIWTDQTQNRQTIKSGGPRFNPRSSHTKDLKKWYLMPTCLTLSIIRYGSKVSGTI